MAKRPVFIPKPVGIIGVEEKIFDFAWHSGFSKSQKQKSIQELHKVAQTHGISSILEISSKSEESLGVKLSSFNLCITTKVKHSVFTVETAFQGSKVFEKGGAYRDLIGMDSKAAKKDIRLKESGNLIEFEFFGKKFPLIPRTFFYDWIYINALNQNQHLAEQLVNYNGFSDIEFNPNRSINCQAYSAALYLSLCRNDCLVDALSSSDKFLEIINSEYKVRDNNIAIQGKLGFTEQD